MKKILDVPYFRQSKDNTCLPTSVAMVLNYYGENILEQGVVNNCKRDLTGYFYKGKLISFLRNLDFSVSVSNNNSLGRLISLIDREIPPLVRVGFFNTGFPHWMVVKGYDLDNEWIYFNDPIGKIVDHLDFENFEKMSKVYKRNNNCERSKNKILLIHPRD